jgi:hypothetical protein
MHVDNGHILVYIEHAVHGIMLQSTSGTLLKVPVYRISQRENPRVKKPTNVRGNGLRQHILCISRTDVLPGLLAHRQCPPEACGCHQTPQHLPVSNGVLCLALPGQDIGG